MGYVNRRDKASSDELQVLLKQKEELEEWISALEKRPAQSHTSLTPGDETSRFLAEHVTDIIFIQDMDLKITYVNPSVEALSGYSVEEIMKLSMQDIMTPDSYQRGVESFKKYAALVMQGTEVEIPLLEYEYVRKDGTTLWGELKVDFLRDKRGNLVGILGILRDITQRKKLENQLMQAQKMEAVGRLAGGIAHDFNNLLTTILGYSEVILMTPDLDHRIACFVREIKKAGDRAASLTQQLLAYSRKQFMKQEVLYLNNLVTGLMKTLISLLGKNIELRTELDPELWSISNDKTQVEKVIVNLVMNARDAMPGGGEITLETGNIISDEKLRLRHPEIPQGEFVFLKVCDTGHGMNKVEQDHIFDPFFTTKGVGKGTGLGLSTVYGIVRQSGGYIFVDSKPDQGTVFELFFSRAQEKDC